MTLKKNSLFVIAAVLLVNIISGCSKKSKDNPSPLPLPPVPKVNVQLANSTQFGSVIKDSTGRSLYFFAVDASTGSNCNGACAVTWLPFYEANPVLPNGLKMSDFGTITRADGSKQTTYKNWPLYRNINDVNPGDEKGDNVGGVWFVAKPDYTVMLAKGQLVGADGNQYTSLYTVGAGSTVYITDSYGLTLYAYSKDSTNTNTFTKADLSNNAAWPIYQASSKTIPSALDATLFGTTTIGGKTQFTYKGWPLYNFGNDSQTKGNTKGVSVGRPGLWMVLNQTTGAAQ
jgi:predicted lipoprotein with Yx(FWY)xxD motif